VRRAASKVIDYIRFDLRDDLRRELWSCKADRIGYSLLGIALVVILVLIEATE
jgi:hypothetical protein